MKIIDSALINIQFEHQLWLNEIAFAFKEITIYEDRLLEMIQAQNEKGEKTELGRILLLFMEQKNMAELIQKQIKEHLTHMKHKISSNGELKSIINTVHQKTKKDLKLFRKSYEQLKQEVRQTKEFRS